MIDYSAYRRDVLDPACANGDIPPADLFVRYGLDPARPLTEPEFQRHVADIERYWRRLKQKIRYRKLIDALLAGHRELTDSGRLSWEAFARDRDERRESARSLLDRQIKNLALSTPCVSAATVGHLVSRANGACTPDFITERLAAAGLRVVDPLWELPPGPPGHGAFSGHLRLLGVRFSLDLVYGAGVMERGFRFRPDFRLDGVGTVTPDAIREAIEQTRRRARDERTPAADGVLTLLERAVRTPGALDELLLWEVAEALRRSASRMPVRDVADEAVALGLVRAEAEELALTLHEHEAGPTTGARAEIEAALAGGDPRAAERWLDRLPERETELRERVEAALARIAEALARAGALLDHGRSEEAAEILSHARGFAPADEPLAARLAAIAPPPATDVLVGVESGRVALSWTPGAARVGPVTHRVVRTMAGPASSASAGTVVAEVTGDNEAVDDAPPAAADLFYSVFARRDGGGWSPPSTGPPVRCTPEVTDVTVVADERSVRVSWTPHQDVVGVQVVRLGDGLTIRAAREGFTDDDDTVRPGRPCRYRIQAVYETPSAGRELTPGVEVAATPREPPAAVPGLTAVPQGTTLATVTWERPRAGRVVIRAGRGTPPWSEGDVLPPGDVERFGRELTGTPEPIGDGRFSLTTAIEAGLMCFAAVTLGGGRAVAGPIAFLKVAEPVRGLRLRRLGGQVRLSWEWPDGATAVEVAWTPSGGDTSTVVELGRRAYLDNRGCVLDVGPDPGRVEVKVTRVGRTAVASAPVQGHVPGASIRVGYEFRRRRRLFRADRALLRLTVEQPLQLPELIVVHGTGPTLPLRPDQGEIVHRIPPQPLTPDLPREVEIAVPKSRPSWLVCFAEDGDPVALTRLRGNW